VMLKSQSKAMIKFNAGVLQDLILDIMNWVLIVTDLSIIDHFYFSLKYGDNEIVFDTRVAVFHMPRIKSRVLSTLLPHHITLILYTQYAGTLVDKACKAKFALLVKSIVSLGYKIVRTQKQSSEVYSGDRCGVILELK
jgi:hypothetical protein